MKRKSIHTYLVTKEGRIFRELSGRFPSKDYPQILLQIEGVRKARYIHHFVWEAFNGPVPKGYEINHIDGNKQNTDLSNLELVTKAENMQHACLTGLMHYKLTPEEVIIIRDSKEKQSIIAKRFKIHQSHVSKIKSKQRRYHVSSDV